MTSQVRFHAVPLDPFQESVYLTVPEVYVPKPKPPRHQSQYAPQAAAEYVSGLKAAATMGPSKVRLAPPKEFLKKRGGALAYSADAGKKVAERPLHTECLPRPPVPKRSDIVTVMQVNSKDFIKVNALDVINATAAKKFTDESRYINKPDFAKVPKYLAARQAEAAALADKYKAHQNDVQTAQQLQSGLIMMPQSERLAMLGGLKKNWEKLNLEYKRLSLTVDTVPKIARKVSLEQNLKKLEDFIKKFSNPNVMVNFNEVYD